MNKFNKSIAKEIAQKQLDHTIDCVIGVTDDDYHLSDDLDIYEQNFEKDLQGRGINPTSVKIIEINKQYKRMVDKAVNYLKKMQSS